MHQFIKKIGKKVRVLTHSAAKHVLFPVSKLSRIVVVCPPSNSVLLDEMSEGHGKITINGSGNVVEILEGSLFNGNIDIQGNNNRVLIGPHCAIRGRILVKGSKQTVAVGERTTFQSVYLLCQENCDVMIGRWCMFSRNIEIRTTDAHSVVDAQTGRRLNEPASVTIGDHVWVSVGVLISKGATLPEDSIVGANSFVNDVFVEPGTLIAGAPAKVVKRGVTWHRSRKAKFTKEELDAWRVPSLVEDEVLIREEE